MRERKDVTMKILEDLKPVVKTSLRDLYEYKTPNGYEAMEVFNEVWKKYKTIPLVQTERLYDRFEFVLKWKVNN